MYIEEIVLEGFKSYCSRTVIGPFSSEYNAITGLNGTGKSNILDALCFVFGIKNLQQMRVSRKDEFVYKQGKAGIDKASVSVKFNNTDKPSPLPAPYTDLKEITITRQIVIGGRERYLINSHNKESRAVEALLHAVNLNVNNPHFLVLQGRINEVVMYKPTQILGLLEEATGTRLYTTKRLNAMKLMEQKSHKVSEIQKTLDNEIQPALDQLEKEKEEYGQWVANKEEIERLQKFEGALKFYLARKIVQQGEKQLDQLRAEKLSNEKQLEEISESVTEITKQKESLIKECEILDKPISELRGKKCEIEKLITTHRGDEKCARKDRDIELKNLQDLEKEQRKLEGRLNEIATANRGNTSQLEELQNAVICLKEEIHRTETKLATITTGISDTDKPGTLRDQLKGLKSKLSAKETDISNQNRTLKHDKAELYNLGSRLKGLNDGEWKELVAQDQQIGGRIKTMEEELRGLENVCVERREVQQLHKSKLLQSKSVEAELHDASSALQNVIVKVRFPANFDPRNYHGQLFQLISLKDKYEELAPAVEQLVGNNLNYLLVEDKASIQPLLRYNRFAEGAKKVTFWPMLEGEVGKYLAVEDIAHCRNLVGTSASDMSRVISNYDIINYESPKYDKVVKYVFGKSLICRVAEDARTITYQKDKRLAWRTATVEGDLFNPSGSMTGGGNRASGRTLYNAKRYKDVELRYNALRQEILELENTLKPLDAKWDHYESLGRQLELERNEQRSLQERLKISQQGHLVEAQQKLIKKIEASNLYLEEMRIECEELSKEIQDLEREINDIESNKETRERELAAKLKQLRIKHREAEKLASTKGEAMSGVRIEIDKLNRQVQLGQEETETKKKLVAELEEVAAKSHENASIEKEKIKELESKLKQHEEEIIESRNELASLQQELEKLEKRTGHINMDMKRLDHRIGTVEGETRDAKTHAKELKKKLPWLTPHEDGFENMDMAFDFENRPLATVQKQLEELAISQDALQRRVNKNAVQKYNETKQSATTLVSRRMQVEEDRLKIVDVIADIDERRKKSLKSTWEQVSQNFSSIFSALLPHAQAKLEPHDKGPHEGNEKFLNGLDLKVAFNNRWKESLSELSGGQRSLLALSLILALLKCEPAPVYILDEVDAALDLSHTQNMGSMIKSQFKNSQFIIVSLKEGMFSHADVVFRTFFLDGSSMVERISSSGESVLLSRRKSVLKHRRTGGKNTQMESQDDPEETN